MKKFIMAMLFVLAMVIPASAGVSWEKNLHIEWGYSPPSDLVVSEYRLYQDGSKVCTWVGATTQSGDCKVTLGKSSTQFTLTAAFTSGGETPHSPPFTFSDFGKGPSIIILIGK